MTTIYTTGVEILSLDLKPLIDAAKEDGLSCNQIETLEKIGKLRVLSDLVPDWISSAGKVTAGISAIFSLGFSVGVLRSITNLSPTSTVIYGLFAAAFGIAAHDGLYIAEGFTSRIRAIVEFTLNLRDKDAQADSNLGTKIIKWIKSDKILVIDEKIAETVEQTLEESGQQFSNMWVIPNLLSFKFL